MNAISIYRQTQARQMVVDLRPQLTERGKIKIGRLGDKRMSKSSNEWQAPIKLDHFTVTTLVRGADNNFVRDEQVHKTIGDRPTEIPIRLMFDDIALNMQTRYVAFKGKSVWCQGDGEKAVRDGQDRACPCPNRERGFQASTHNPVCKINGRLQVMVDNAESVGGVWVFRTTSWNSVQGLVSSMMLIQQITAGRLAGVPLVLTVQPKKGHDDQQRPVTIYVVGIEYRGTIESLRDRAYQAALADAQQGERYAHAIEDARRMLAAPVVSEDEETDVAAEFYPEEPEDAPREPHRPTGTNPEPPADVTYVYDLQGSELAIATAEVASWARNEAMAAVDRAQCEMLASMNPDFSDAIMNACPHEVEPPPPEPEKPKARALFILDANGNPLEGPFERGGDWLPKYRNHLGWYDDKAAFARANIDTLRIVAVAAKGKADGDLQTAEALCAPAEGDGV